MDDHLFSAVLLCGSWISTRQGSLLYRVFHICHDTNITCAWQTQCLVLNRLPKGNHSTQCPLDTSPHLIGSKWGSKLPILSIEPRSVPHHTDDLVKILIKNSDMHTNTRQQYLAHGMNKIIQLVIFDKKKTSMVRRLSVWKRRAR